MKAQSKSLRVFVSGGVQGASCASARRDVGLPETPEGPACGLIVQSDPNFERNRSETKAFALGSRVTHPLHRATYLAWRQRVLELLETTNDGPAVYVFLNGDILGRVTDVEDTVLRIRSLPPPDAAPHAVATVFLSPSDRSIYVFTDDGRVVRPLLDAKTVLSGDLGSQRPDDINGLLASGAIRYVDSNEINTLSVALLPAIATERPVDLVEVVRFCTRRGRSAWMGYMRTSFWA